METYRKHMENITISYQLIEVHRNNQEVNRTNLEAPGKYKEPMENKSHGNIWNHLEQLWKYMENITISYQLIEVHRKFW